MQTETYDPNNKSGFLTAGNNNGKEKQLPEFSSIGNNQKTVTNKQTSDYRKKTRAKRLGEGKEIGRPHKTEF